MSKAKIISDAISPVLTPASMPDRSTSQNRSDRRAIKRSMGISVNLLDYAPAGTTDWATALNEAIVDVGTTYGTTGDIQLILPAGNFNLGTQILMDYPVQIRGQGLGQTVLQPTHSGTGILVTGKYGTCPRLEDFTIGFVGTNGTAHIYVQSYQDPVTPTINYSPDFLYFSNLNLTCYGGHTVQYNIVLDGNGRLNDVGGTVPIGLRSITLKDIVAFNASFRALDLRHVRVASFYSTHFYGGAGIGGAAVTGYDASHKCYDTKFFGCSINGSFSVSQSDACELHGVTYSSLSTGPGVTNFVDV